MSSDSTDSKFGANKNPRHFMVLDAIARGIKDIDGSQVFGSQRVL
jgi:hypothetical protein